MKDAGFDALKNRVAALSPEQRALLERRLAATTCPAPSADAPAGEALVTVRGEGEGWPLFLAVPSAGTLRQVRRLVERLDTGFPVYALVPAEHDIPLEAAAARRWLIEAAAAAIRSVRPHGPYLLGGFCLGGLYAIEVARALVEAGEEVAACVLLDAPYPLSPVRRRTARLVDLVGHHLRGITDGGPGRAVGYVAQRLRRIPAFLRGVRVKRAWMERAVREDPSLEVSLRAFRDVPLSPLPVPLALLVAAEGLTRDGSRRRRRRWTRIAPLGLAVTLVPGAHDTLFEPENLGALSSAVTRALRDAARDLGPSGSKVST